MQPPPWEKRSLVETLQEGQSAREGFRGTVKGCPFAFAALRHTAQPTAKPLRDTSSYRGPRSCMRTSQSCLITSRRKMHARER